MVTTPKLLFSDRLMGYWVTNNAGENLAKVEDFVIDAERGCIALAVLSFGGFLGMGGKLFPVPWEALQLSSDEDKFILDMDKDLLKGAPSFDRADKDRWPAMVDRGQVSRIYRYFGYAPYWEGSTGSTQPSQSLEEHEKKYHEQTTHSS